MNFNTNWVGALNIYFGRIIQHFLIKNSKIQLRKYNERNYLDQNSSYLRMNTLKKYFI